MTTMLLYMLIYATILNIAICPIFFVYKEKVNAARIILGLIYGLFWPISFPVLIAVFYYCKIDNE
jgi:predicted MFS family arabinose efflux permease